MLSAFHILLFSPSMSWIWRDATVVVRSEWSVVHTRGTAGCTWTLFGACFTEMARSEELPLGMLRVKSFCHFCLWVTMVVVPSGVVLPVGASLWSKRQFGGVVGGG
jgi:hypothetical protein